MPKAYLLLICFSFSLKFAFAQFNEADFQRYTVLNGLSDNNVTSIVQDKLGFMWIGTEVGLNSFDGENFDRYFSHNKPFSLVASSVDKLIPFSNNRLGVVTREGLQVINTQNKSVEDYRFPDTSFFSHYNNSVYDAMELPDKSVLFSSNTGIYQLYKPGGICFRYDNYTAAAPENKRVLYARDILSVNNSEILIFTIGDKMDHYDPQKKEFYHVSPSSPRWSVLYPDPKHGSNCKKIAENQFIIFNHYSDSLIFYDRLRNMRVVSRPPHINSEEMNWSSKVFMLTDTSFVINSPLAGFYLFKLNKRTGVISGDGRKFLSGFKCNYFFVDKEKKLWIGTRTGLLRQKGKTPFVSASQLFNPQDAGSNARFTSVCRYKDKLYVGSFNRMEGLFVVDTATMQVTKKLTFYGGNNGWSEIESIQCYHKDTLWLGTSKGLLWFDVRYDHYGYVMDDKKDSVLVDGNPKLLPVDKKGRAWLLDYLNGKAGYYDTTKRTFTFFTATTVPALPFSRIKHIVYDAYGDVWLAGHGLARWNDVTGRFDTFMNVYAGPNKYREDILTIAADKKGSLWLYNAENVLLEYKIKEKKFYVHGADEGLPVFVQSMAEEVNDKLWFTTGSRLICYTPSTRQVVNFDQGDGLPVERASARIIFYDKGRDCFYSVHNNYLATFNANISKSLEGTSHLLITKLIFADSIFYNPASAVQVDYTRQNFSLHFTALNFDTPNSCSFYYSVDDKEWTYLNGLEEVAFNHLSPGSHRIQIKAITKFGRKLITSIMVTILPPFWQRWWFMTMLFLAVVGILYVLYNYRIAQIIKLQALRNDIARDLHDDIASTMGSISIYSEIASEKIKKQQPIVAEEILQKIGAASRQMIDRMSDIVWSINTTNDHLENLTDRMKAFCSMTLTPAGIDFYFDVQAAFSGAALPMDKRKNIFLIFKECIHNILKHADCKHVTIAITLQHHKITMSVKDDGRGFDQKNTKAYNGNGLNNMRKRAGNMFGKLTIHSFVDVGTIVELHLDI